VAAVLLVTMREPQLPASMLSLLLTIHCLLLL
jgi:hypothetical protein